MKYTIKLQPVILCGGSGTRLWPLSRTGFPKRFLCLTGQKSLFQQAAKRLVSLGTDSMQVTNPGAIPLEIVEVQSGSYLGEDDIVRIEDRYGRQNG
jgi:mannose-1-phosphate guanylyltransferase